MSIATQEAFPGLPEPPVPVPPRRRSEDYHEWAAETRPVFVTVAISGRRFTSYEIADEYDLADPPNPKSHWGQFIHRLHECGLIEHVGYDDTTRPDGADSAVKVWRGTRDARAGRIA